MRPIFLKIRKQLEKFQSDYPYWRNDLGGACATASLMVTQELDKVKIPFSLIKGVRGGISHVWVETENHLIDLTYTQFEDSAPKVLIVSKKTHKYESYKNFFTYSYTTDLMDLRVWQVKENPFKCLNKMKKRGLKVNPIQRRKISTISMKWGKTF